MTHAAASADWIVQQCHNAICIESNKRRFRQIGDQRIHIPAERFRDTRSHQIFRDRNDGVFMHLIGDRQTICRNIQRIRKNMLVSKDVFLRVTVSSSEIQACTVTAAYAAEFRGKTMRVRDSITSIINELAFFPAFHQRIHRPVLFHAMK